jgi:hypothetical protein
MLTELHEGWRAVRDRPWVLVTIICFSAALLTALAPFFVLGASVANQVYGTEAVYGLAKAAFGVGTITGALIGSRWRPATRCGSVRPSRCCGRARWPYTPPGRRCRSSTR